VELVNLDSGIQRIVLRRDPRRGLSLWLDGSIQFRERHEFRYHEALGVLPMLYGDVRSVLICGGGDGLLAARILKFDGVGRIVNCDYDPQMTRLAREQPDLAALNEASFADPRVEIVNEDAYGYLEASGDRFDLICCDFPDPWHPPLGRLYSREFYELAAARLGAGGLLVTQTCMAGTVAPVIHNTVKAVFADARHYWVWTEDFLQSGFTLASQRPLARRRAVPGGCRFLTDELADALLVRSADETAALAAESEISTVDNQLVVKRALAASLMARGELVHDYHYNSDCRVLMLDKRLRTSEPDSLRLAISGLDEQTRLIVYADEVRDAEFGPFLRGLGYRCDKTYSKIVTDLDDRSMADAERHWQRLFDGTVTQVEERFASRLEDREIDALMREYLASYAHHFFDTADGEAPMGERAHYFIARRPDGGAVAIAKLLDESERAPDGPEELEATYARGSPRENLLAIALIFRKLHENGITRVTMLSPDQNIDSLALSLGGRLVDRYSVYARPQPPRGQGGQGFGNRAN